jgi:hypothetical protein
MENKVKIDSVNISVPFRGPGNAIRQKEIGFDVYKVYGHFEAVPTCDQQDRVLASIPARLDFDCRDGKPYSLRGKRDGNMQVISDLVEELTRRKVI